MAHNASITVTSGTEVKGLTVDHQLLSLIGATDPTVAATKLRDGLTWALVIMYFTRSTGSLAQAEAFVNSKTTLTD